MVRGVGDVGHAQRCRFVDNGERPGPFPPSHAVTIDHELGVGIGFLDSFVKILRNWYFPFWNTFASPLDLTHLFRWCCTIAPLITLSSTLWLIKPHILGLNSTYSNSIYGALKTLYDVQRVRISEDTNTGKVVYSFFINPDSFRSYRKGDYKQIYPKEENLPAA